MFGCRDWLGYSLPSVVSSDDRELADSPGRR
jgi:hypothetical protein